MRKRGLCCRSVSVRLSQCSTVVRTVVRATQQVNGKWQFWGCRRQYGEIYPSRTFFIFFEGDFLRASTEKNTQQCQALNGLKYSTVGNLGS